MVEEVKDTIFVGGIPYDMTLEEFEEEVQIWGPVTKKYLKFHGGWGTVTFESNRSRNMFLKDKSKHKVGSKLVDVKPYIYNPDKVKSTGTSHLVIGKGQVKLTSETAIKAKDQESKNTSIIEKQMSDLQVNNQVEAQTGTIMRYNGDKDGIIKTPKHGEIAFSMETVYLCKVHKLFCRDAQCPHYLPLKKWNSSDLAQLMPAGTMVSFYSRQIQFKDTPENKYQATLVWPQASKKPSTASLLTADELNQIMIRFAVAINQKPIGHQHAWTTVTSQQHDTLSKSSSPTPSQASSNTSSKISASNGPPGFSQAQVNAFTQMLNNSDSKPKFDYDMPLEALLDDGGDDIDNEAEILMWIKDFLTNELGKLGVNVPMLLMNNIRSLGSDELVLQEIVNFAKGKQIPIDNSKRESIAYGLKKLRQKIRGRENLDHQVAALDKQDSLLSQYLQTFNDHDLDFIYNMPLNSEYLSLLETFYGKFLKSENLDFRMDFDQAFKKLSPFMAFKTFSWILDWMTNDRRKKLRQHSDLKYFNDSEEILGAVEQFWNNLKRMRAKHLVSAFLNVDKDRTSKMLIYYIKYHILDLDRLAKVVKVMKKLKPDELDKELINGKNLSMLPEMKIEFEGKKSSRIDVDGLKNHYGRLLTWLDLQLITKGLVLIYDSFDLEGRPKNDLDFQKLAIANTWFSMSKTCNDLEDDILQAGNSLKTLVNNWTKTCLLDYDGPVEIDTGTVVKATLDFLADKLGISKMALDFAWSISDDQGFVAHHYNENIGIILTVKGEIVIFEKSVVFKQEGYHDWCKIDQVQQLTVGSYVKLRKHPSNVAEKVWSCHDFGTLEPSRPASTNVKGDKYYYSMAKNQNELAKKLPALKSVVGPKALLKDLYFTLKTFGYMPNIPKRNSFDPYLESKEPANGDHSEAVDILSSQDITLGQLTDIYMASKLLGFEGHEKLLDILAVIKVGVPDPLNFAMDLTAFFEENCKSEILSEKASAKNDVKTMLKAAERYIVKSGLFGYDMTNSSSSKQDNNSFGKHKQQNTSSEQNHLHTVNHNQLPNGNGNSSNNGTANYNYNHDYDGLQGTSHYDSEQNSYGGMVDSLRIEAMEKNISLLNREVKKIKLLEDGERQLEVDLGHMKRDHDAKQAVLKTSLKPILDKLTELAQDLEAVKTDIKTMKGLKLAPGMAPFKAAKNSSTNSVYVRVAMSHNKLEVHEFPTDESGNLSITTVNAVYPGVNALKFTTETNSIRLCRKIGDIFEPPEDGWGDRLYIVHAPGPPLYQQGVPTSVPSLAPSAFAGSPLFPGYMSNPSTGFSAPSPPGYTGNPLANNLSANLFNTQSMFK